MIRASVSSRVLVWGSAKLSFTELTGIGAKLTILIRMCRWMQPLLAIAPNMPPG
jgi:hypothetical protein